MFSRVEMARHRSSKKLFSRVYSPVHHLLSATRNVGRSLFTRSGRVVDQGLAAVNNVGSSMAKHANMAVRNVTRRRSASRKHRKNTRRNRK
jgi:hypothetical protein